MKAALCCRLAGVSLPPVRRLCAGGGQGGGWGGQSGGGGYGGQYGGQGGGGPMKGGYGQARSAPYNSGQRGGGTSNTGPVRLQPVATHSVPRIPLNYLLLAAHILLRGCQLPTCNH